MTTGNTLDDWDGFISSIGYGSYRSKVWAGADRTDALPANTEHGYTATLKERKMSVLSYKLLASTVYTRSTYQFCPGLPKVGTFPQNECVAKVWDKLSQTRFNAGVFAGEFRETVDFISGSIRALALSVRSVRAGRFKRAIRELLDRPAPPKTLLTKGARNRRPGENVGVLANNWLSYYYALVPLLSDIEAGYKYLTTNYETISYLKVSAKREETKNLTLTNVTWSYESKAIYEIRGKIISKVSTVDRIGLTDPFSIAWELTRLSFVVDWITPIGTFLQAVNAKRKCEFEQLFCTKASFEYLYGPLAKSVVGFTFLTPPKTEDFARHVFVQRSSLGSLDVKLPSIENPLDLSYQKYVTSTALLHQAFGRF